MTSRPLWMVAVVVLLAGCTPTSGQADPEERLDLADTSYEVFPPTARFGDTPRALLRNTGKVPLEYHHDFLLETFVDGSWQTIQQPTGRESMCDFSSTALLLHPGDSESQGITACNGHGRPRALPAGRYRVTKIVLTVPSDPDGSPTEIQTTSEFEVAEPLAEIPDPSECVVLCISDTRVEGGEVVQVSFAPPRRYIWGVPSEIHAGTAETITPVAWLTAWQDKDQELMTNWPGERFGWEDIGFRGSDEWDWLVPTRLEPGIYSIVKEGITEGNSPVEDRIKTWTVSFEVTENL